MKLNRRLFLIFWLSIAMHPVHYAVAADPPQSPAKRAINPPPSATLDYRITARQSGVELDGTAVVRWQATRDSYRIETETRSALLGKILETNSVGSIDPYGLAPAVFTEKKFRKKAENATFDRIAKSVSFAGSSAPQSLTGGEQDRSSVVWQLASIARASPAQFKDGSQWTFTVASSRGADPWTFRVMGREKVRTPAGNFNAVHIQRKPPDGKGQQLAVWLAPELEWYPVKIRFTDNDRDVIEQSLVKVTR